MRRSTLLLLPLTLALAACEDSGPGAGWQPTPPSAAVKEFIDQEALPRLHFVHRIAGEYVVEFFWASYGEGQDCPSGCIYSMVYGVRVGGKIGWFAQADGEGHVPDPSRYFDVVPTDVALFQPNTWGLLMAADTSLCWGGFLPYLAADPDTDRDALLSLAGLLYATNAYTLAQALIGNETVRTDVQILQLLADLPESSGSYYTSVRQEAQWLLGGLAP